MKTAEKLFTPLTEVSKSTMNKVAATQLLFLLFAWSFLVPAHTVFPNLIVIIKALGELWKNGLFYHILATLGLCGAATVISIVFSSLLAYSSRIPFFKPFIYLLTTLRYNPIQGFTVFLTIATGGGRMLQIILLVIFMSFYFVSGLISIIDDIPEEDIVRRKAMRMSNWLILLKVVILDRLDSLIEVIRQNLSITLMMIVTVEGMDKSQGGLGALLLDTNRAMNFPKIFALQLCIYLIGRGLDKALKALFNSFPANRKDR